MHKTAERAGKAHREPHRRAQSNKTDERTKSDLGCQTEEQANKERVNREKGSELDSNPLSETQ